MDLNTLILLLILLALLVPKRPLRPALPTGMIVPPSLVHQAQRTQMEAENLIRQVGALILDQSAKTLSKGGAR